MNNHEEIANLIVKIVILSIIPTICLVVFIKSDNKKQIINEFLEEMKIMSIKLFKFTLCCFALFIAFKIGTHFGVDRSREIFGIH